MDDLITSVFWRAAAIRAMRTWAQTVLALAGGDALNLLPLNWKQWLIASVGTAALSLLNSIVTGIPEAPKSS